MCGRWGGGYDGRKGACSSRTPGVYLHAHMCEITPPWLAGAWRAGGRGARERAPPGVRGRDDDVHGAGTRLEPGGLGADAGVCLRVPAVDCM